MSETLTLPVLPLRETVIFPGVNSAIGAGRAATMRAIQKAADQEGKLLFAVSQRENLDEVRPEILFTIGTIARIGQMQRVSGGVQMLLHGVKRGIAMRYSPAEDHLEAVVREVEELEAVDPKDPAFLALLRELRARAGEVGQKAGFPEEVVRQVLEQVDQPGKLADLVASYLELPHAESQSLLETLSIEERLRRVLVNVQRQINVLDAQQEIKSKVQQEIGDRQREIFLREQLKAIRRELGEEEEGEEVDELRRQVEALELPEEARREVDRELGRLGRMSRESMEYQVIRTYLETVAELPWQERSADDFDLARAAKILEEDHYGLDEVKDRVLEFLAVRRLRAAKDAAAAEDKEAADGEEKAAAAEAAGGNGGSAVVEGQSEPKDEGGEQGEEPPDGEQSGEQAGEQAGEQDGAPDGAPDGVKEPPPGYADDRTHGPILLFVGPPGTGKTSIARSIARSMDRKYVRVSLGGARDEADIRGHRRTYVGAMPGRVLKGMKDAGTKNPVFLLDEVDKLGVSYQGDPASALLEVLDPAQNNSFVDHYVGVPFDLSEVLFIATANFLQSIPGPLLDRMEMVEFSGYTEREKSEIARRYLVPRQVAANALDADQIEFSDEAIAEVITRYTREAGVRQLERELGKLARKAARRIAAGDAERVELTSELVTELLGRPRIHPEKAAGEDQVGVATGMFYTPSGGDIMFVETTLMRGKGEVVLTGQLGDVMKESARAAWSYARSHAADLQIPAEEFADRDVHVHCPAGAIPKDGPSAGVTMATALVSALSGRPARHDIAMTGEITLSGRVLPIGGVKEKVLGAVRAGIRHIILPRQNVADLEDLTDEVRESLEVIPVDELGEVLAAAIRGGSFEGGRLLFADDADHADATEPTA